MSSRMQYPLSQRRHTNIAVVRHTKNGVRLEIACYKNKVISYRSGIEDRLDEVLQVDRIFTNVGRGFIASKEDIATVFGADVTEEEAIKFILTNGDFQVAQQERTAEVDELSKDIAIIISQKCVNTKTQRPFPTVIIEQALTSIGAGVKLDQQVKKQALALIHQLIESQVIPIARANMKLRCLTPSEAGLALLDRWCEESGAQVVERRTIAAAAGGGGEDAKQHHTLLILIQPNLFRNLDNFTKDKMPPGSTVHVVDAAAMEVGDVDAAALGRLAINIDGDSDDDDSGGVGRGVPRPKRTGGRGGNSLATSSAGGGVGEESHSDDDDNDSTGRRGGKKGKAGRAGGRKKKGKNSLQDSDSDGDGNQNSNNHMNANDDSDDDDDDDGKRGKKKGKKAKKQQQQQQQSASGGGSKIGSAALTAQLVKLGFDPATDLADHSDDDGGRGKSGKKGKGKGKNKGGGGGGAQPKQQQQQQAAAAAKAGKDGSDDDGSDSGGEDDMIGNRRQRKKQSQKSNTNPNTYCNPSDEDFDYGEDEEREHQE